MYNSAILGASHQGAGLSPTNKSGNFMKKGGAQLPSACSNDSIQNIKYKMKKIEQMMTDMKTKNSQHESAK